MTSHILKIQMNELNEIIDGGYCIGCGACSSINKRDIKIIENEYGQYKPTINKQIDSETVNKALSVCPFSNSGLNEDEISEKVFDYQEGKVGDVIGYYRSLFAGHVTDDNLRLKTTSGGIITWALSQLLEKDMIDAVIHIHKSSKENRLFEYGISRTTKEIMNAAKSRYYPIELSEVIDFVKNNEGRYAFVGLPCFNKAMRRICEIDPIVNNRVKFFIGLVCGHLKSKAFSEFIAWKAGFDPKNISEIDYRHKLEGKPADQYGIQVIDKNGKSNILETRKIPGTNWGLGYFKLEACDYCDDIFSETADLAVGDAWLNSYTSDYKGNSVIIVRNKELDELIKKGVEEKTLHLDKLTEDEMRNSQGGGFRHRRSGLEYRLYLKKRKNEWAPHKRVPINRNGISISRKFIYILRVHLRERSLENWKRSKESNNYSDFEKRMSLLTNTYYFLLKIVAFFKKR